MANSLYKYKRKGKSNLIMSGEIMGEVTLTPIVTALQNAIEPSDIVDFFATGVTVALPLILTWFGARWIYARFKNAVKGGRG